MTTNARARRVGYNFRVMTNPTTESFPYLHGFSQTEQQRLRRQARIAEALIYRDIDFSERSEILEVGCGVGAQTEVLLRRFADLKVYGIDLNTAQLDAAKINLDVQAGFEERYQFAEQDATRMDFDDNRFDGAFICWMLEHVSEPAKVLSEVRRVIRPGSPVYLTEVMNSSFFLDPYSPSLWKYWMAFNDYQIETGGDPFVGAKLGNLLLTGGYSQVETSIKTFHFDNRRPNRRKTMIAFWEELLLSAAEQLLAAERVDQKLVDDMHQEIQQVQNDPNAVFFYSFVQARATV